MTTATRSLAAAALLAATPLALCAAQRHPPQLALDYGAAASAGAVAGSRVYEVAVEPVEGTVYVYGTIHMGPANPIKYVNGIPEWRPIGPTVEGSVDTATSGKAASGGFVLREQKPVTGDPPQILQSIAVGRKADEKFTPIARFGMGNDGRHGGGANVCAWVSDGNIDYFAPYLRPNTPYDFKLRLDLKRWRMSAWVSGRGDDDWFLLAENVELYGDLPQDDIVVNSVQVDLYPDAPQVTGLMVRAEPWAPAERVRAHSGAKKNRAVAPNRGFRFQSMRSTWRQPGKHVTIFREPGRHAAFPDVARAGPKRLVCVWRDGSHSGGEGGLSVTHSDDLGRTWEKPVKLFKERANCPRVQRLNDRAILVLCDTARLDRVDFWRSEDGGRNWKILKKPFDPRAAGGSSQCLVPGRILELSDGSWFLSTSSYAWVPGVRKGIRGDTERLDFYRSTDRGQTWKFLSGPLVSPPYTLSEPRTLEIAPGRLVAYARDSNGERPGARAESSDMGKTWKFRDLPYPIVGRTCAGVLKDGRVMNTFRSMVGRASLWAWIGDVDDDTGPQPVGAHFNDRHSVGLKDGSLHIDNDGVCGQFTKYHLPAPETDQSTLELSFEVKVLANGGRAASIAVPFAGVLRLFPDHVVMAHNPSLRAEVTPGEFHTYRIRSRVGHMSLSIDGKPAWDTDKGDSRLKKISHWLPLTVSGYSLAFGNETADSTRLYLKPTDLVPEVTGYSIWRSFEAITDDSNEKVDERLTTWKAERDGFPDQYQLDNIIEVEASANGYEQGYSGWIQLDDGRIFVVHYTDDSAPMVKGRDDGYGIPWIRGTFLDLSDLPPRRRAP